MRETILVGVCAFYCVFCYRICVLYVLYVRLAVRFCVSLSVCIMFILRITQKTTQTQTDTMTKNRHREGQMDDDGQAIADIHTMTHYTQTNVQECYPIKKYAHEC